MVEWRLYVEGGGDSHSLKTECRRGFRAFLDKAGFKDHFPRIIASGSRNEAFKDFCTATSQGKQALLLVDSEGPVTVLSPWEHLKLRDQWEKPPSAADGQCFLMVQMMESWLLADRKTLSVFFGQGFKEDKLPKNHNLESVPKDDILSSLDLAIKSCKQNKYKKAAHSFRILAQIDPEKVMGKCPSAERFVKELKKHLGVTAN